MPPSGDRRVAAQGVIGLPEMRLDGEDESEQQPGGERQQHRQQAVEETVDDDVDAGKEGEEPPGERRGDDEPRPEKGAEVRPGRAPMRWTPWRR